MDDFERAIRVIFAQDPSITPAVREQATSYCDSIKARPDGWRFCWDRFAQTDSLEVKFWCLQVTLQSMLSLPLDARLELRSKVVSWLREAANKQEEVVVKNKLALIYAGLVRLDYPANWPNAWQELIGLMDQGLPLVDFFLRVLAIFDQEVISDEVQRSNEDRQRSHQIKHAMRERDVVALVECWYRILTTLGTSAPQLVSDCLKVTSLYVVWIEILTVANDKFLSAVCSLITTASPSANEACECLAAVCSKKMPASKKVLMLSELQIFTRLEACVQQGGAQQLLVKEAEMINSIGEVLLEAYVDLRVTDADAKLAQVAWDSINKLMPLVLWFFAQEYQIGVCVEPFLTEFFVKVKSFVKGSHAKDMEMAPCHAVCLDEVRPILMQTLQLIIQRIAYPTWFRHLDPDYEDDEQHVAFMEFRKSLAKIYKRIFLVDEQLGFQFVQASCSQLTQNLQAVQPMEVDAVLFLFKEAGEIAKQLDQHLQAKGPLAGAFLQLTDCEALVNADHGVVQLALMEIYVRYGKLLALHPELFPRYGQRVLQALVSRGIRSSNPHVVSRACFMFGRFLKLVKAQAATLLTQIHEALQDLLVVQYVPSALLPVQAEVSLTKIAVKGSLKADDQAYLYEALASLVTSTKPEEHRPLLEMLLKGPAQTLSEILTGASRAGSDVAGCAGWSGRSIEAIATVSKPFTVQHASTAPAWEAVLLLVAKILEKFVQQLGREIGLWRAALFLCRRMVEVLGDRFLDILDTFLPFLYATNDQTELAELTIFAHHLVCQYQKQMAPYLQKWLPQIFMRPYAVWQQLPEQSEQLKREKLELGAALLQLLKEAAQRCPSAMLEPMLKGATLGPDIQRYAQEMMGFLLIGLQNPKELKALLYSAAAWAAFLEAAAHASAMAALPVAQIFQRVLWSAARMDYNDIQSQKILGEASSILRFALSPRAQPEAQLKVMMEAFQQALVSALPGLRNETAPRKLCEVLAQDGPIKDIRTALQQCIMDWRRESGMA